MHILLTRPLDDCKELILRFKSLGHKVSHLPVIKIQNVNNDKVNFDEFGGIIFTSANAIKLIFFPLISEKVPIAVSQSPSKIFNTSLSVLAQILD